MSNPVGDDTVIINALAEDIQNRLEISNDVIPTDDDDDGNDDDIRPILICDAGYGVPRESRPRQEKILAIARQLANFISWQQQNLTKEYAAIKVVACQDENLKEALKERTLFLLQGTTTTTTSHEDDQSLPNITIPLHLSFSCTTLEDTCREISMKGNEKSVIYLSPDAKESLDMTKRPPRYVVVGLLIDRRIQPYRSHERAKKVNILPKRWPLENCFQNISANEPLNVDCILEGMQQWWWNSDEISSTIIDPTIHRETFLQAAAQAIQHHAERHPSRPIHNRS